MPIPSERLENHWLGQDSGGHQAPPRCVSVTGRPPSMPIPSLKPIRTITVLQSFTVMVRIGFKLGIGMEGGRPVTLTHRGGAWCPPLSCPSQWYSNLSLLWSELAFSWVLAWRVGILWHSHAGGEAGVSPCLVQVNGTPIFHCYGPNWLLAGYWHGGWASCDTHTPGGEPGVPPLSCSSQWYSSLSLSWSVLAYSWVLAWRVGVLWHSHIGGEPGVPRCLVQVNGTPVFHCYGPYWL